MGRGRAARLEMLLVIDDRLYLGESGDKVIKGSNRSSYDAKIIASIFSDYKVNRGSAKVFHDAVLEHNPTSVTRLPVIELDIVKNKASNFSDIIFFLITTTNQSR